LKPGWVAGTTRARLLLGRRAGSELERGVASADSLAEGLSVLVGSAYGERLRAQDDLAAAERAVAETLLWHLRILAGWLPAAGVGLVRALAARFELMNIDARLAALAGDGREPPPFVLGGLATAWPRLEQARTTEELSQALAASAWGDLLKASSSAPAIDPRSSPAQIAIGLRVSWARRVQETAPEASDWVAGAGALLVARELFVAGDRACEAQLRGLPGIGRDALAADSLRELRMALPAHASWALADVDDPVELWRAELDWWLRVERDARLLVRAQQPQAEVLGAVALLAADAQRTVRALAGARGIATEMQDLGGGGA